MNDIQMIAYLTECTVATVDEMATKKSRPSCEYERQKSIAQKGIDYLRNISGELDETIQTIVDSHKCSRVIEILEQRISVSEFAKKYEVPKK